MKVPVTPAPNDMYWLEKKPDPKARMMVHAASSLAMTLARLCRGVMSARTACPATETWCAVLVRGGVITAGMSGALCEMMELRFSMSPPPTLMTMSWCRGGSELSDDITTPLT